MKLQVLTGKGLEDGYGFDCHFCAKFHVMSLEQIDEHLWTHGKNATHLRPISIGFCLPNDTELELEKKDEKRNVLILRRKYCR